MPRASLAPFTWSHGSANERRNEHSCARSFLRAEHRTLTPRAHRRAPACAALRAAEPDVHDVGAARAKSRTRQGSVPPFVPGARRRARARAHHSASPSRPPLRDPLELTRRFARARSVGAREMHSLSYTTLLVPMLGLRHSWAPATRRRVRAPPRPRGALSYARPVSRWELPESVFFRSRGRRASNGNTPHVVCTNAPPRTSQPRRTPQLQSPASTHFLFFLWIFSCFLGFLGRPNAVPSFELYTRCGTGRRGTHSRWLVPCSHQERTPYHA